MDDRDDIVTWTRRWRIVNEVTVGCGAIRAISAGEIAGSRGGAYNSMHGPPVR